MSFFYTPVINLHLTYSRRCLCQLPMIAPMSKGLFDRAISQSGTLMNIWSDPPRPGLAKMRAIRLADKMGCPITDTNYQKILDCLRKVDAKKITQGMYDFFVSGLLTLI